MVGSCNVDQGGSRHEAMFAWVQIWLPSAYSVATKVDQVQRLACGRERLPPAQASIGAGIVVSQHMC